MFVHYKGFLFDPNKVLAVVLSDDETVAFVYISAERFFAVSVEDKKGFMYLKRLLNAGLQNEVED